MGTLSEGSWISEDSAIINEALTCTTVAKTAVSVFEISTSKFRLLPPEALAELAMKSKGKLEWGAERCYNLGKTNIDLLNKDMRNRVYQKSVGKIKERFDQINEGAVKYIRDVMFRKEEQVMNIGMLYKLGNPFFIKRAPHRSRNCLPPLLVEYGTDLTNRPVNLSPTLRNDSPFPQKSPSMLPAVPLAAATSTKKRSKSTARPPPNNHNLNLTTAVL